MMELSVVALPGTHLGQFDRGTDASQLNGVINKYNSLVANQR